jgi:peptidoglycan endopeptidase LytF
LSAKNNPSQNQYTIQEGDTLWEIANQYNTTVEELIGLNPEVDPDNMLIGQAIAIPEQVRRDRRTPYVRRDRWDRRDWRDRWDWRYRRDWRDRWVCPSGASRYYTRPGDTLYTIASRFGVSVDYIIDANPYINFNLPLRVGQLICLP